MPRFRVQASEYQNTKAVSYTHLIRTEKAGAFSGPRKSGLLDHADTILSGPAPLVKRIVLFVLFVHYIPRGCVLYAARFANVIADVFMNTLAAGPHRFARWVVCLLYTSLRCIRMSLPITQSCWIPCSKWQLCIFGSAGSAFWL